VLPVSAVKRGEARRRRRKMRIRERRMARAAARLLSPEPAEEVEYEVEYYGWRVDKSRTGSSDQLVVTFSLEDQP
jgi:hypothetical protein